MFKSTRWVVILAAAAAIGYYYFWAVRASGSGFEGGRDLGGFYDYLGRALAHRHLYLPIVPAPELLALPNPWDPAAGSDYKVYDLALYKQRYYLYHGVGPALMLFAPWRILAGRDLPESFAVFLFALGGFLFSCAILLRLLALLRVKLGPVLLATLLLALGLCQGVPYLLSRVFVYEVAISGGYFCLAAALYFLTLALPSGNRYYFAASGLMFGMSVACRPNLVFAAGIALIASVAYLGQSRRAKEILPFFASLCAIGLAIAAYNYARFDNPFEFGLNYLLGGGSNQNRIKLDAGFLLPGLYFFLACAPNFSPVFPWVRLVFRYPFGSANISFPTGYFIEPTAGALFVTPFLAAVFLIPSRDPLKRVQPEHFSAARMLLWTTLAISLGGLLSVAWTGFTTQRYEVDFLPGMALVGLVNLVFYIDRSSGFRRRLLSVAVGILVGYSAVVNLALGVSGPYDDMLKNHPKRYMRLANWFSPLQQFRPLLNPYVSISFTAQLTTQPEGFRDPLVTLGSRAYRHFVYIEHRNDGLHIVSRSGDSTTIEHALTQPAGRPFSVEVSYSPDSSNLTTKVNGETVLVHRLPGLLTAPSEVTVGENRIDNARTAPRFTGVIRDVQKTVRQN